MIGPMVGPVDRRRPDRLRLVALDLFSQHPDRGAGRRAGAVVLQGFPGAGAGPVRSGRLRDHRGGAVHARTGARESRASGAADGARHRLLPDRGGDAAGLLAPCTAQPGPGARPRPARHQDLQHRDRSRRAVPDRARRDAVSAAAAVSGRVRAQRHRSRAADLLVDVRGDGGAQPVAPAVAPDRVPPRPGRRRRPVGRGDGRVCAAERRTARRGSSC